jgi:hypothetical protein
MSSESFSKSENETVQTNISQPFHDIHFVIVDAPFDSLAYSGLLLHVYRTDIS